MQWINGNVQSREILTSDLPPGAQQAAANYNDVLAALIRDRDGALDIICRIPDIRLRAITALIIVDIPRQTVADLLSMSARQLRRIINNITS